MGDIYKQKKNFRKNTNSPEAPPLGNFPCMASEVSTLSIPESMCETSCLRTPLPCLTPQHPKAETAQVSPKSVLWAQHSPDLLPQWSRTHNLNWTMEAVSSLVSLLLCPPLSVPHMQSEGACEHLSQTRTLLAQSPPLASTSHQNRTGHSSVPVPHSAPSHLRVFAHVVPSS